MDSVKNVLRSANINCSDLDVLSGTDRGDVLVFTAPGGTPAIALWKQLRELSKQTNHWPVLLGSEKEIARYREQFEMNGTNAQETLTYASTIDAQKWFVDRAAQRLEEFKEFNEGEDPDLFMVKVGEWPDDASPTHQFMTPFDIRTRKPQAKIAMALAPTSIPWEVPAFLSLGGWNECPEAAVHCAIQKYWHQKYDAVIVAATHDVLEMNVSRPPKTRDDALSLAKEQYNYCADIVEQGTETLSGLAGGLLDGSSWYFWWD
jgi:Domain of unknown function (DUF4253)